MGLLASALDSVHIDSSSSSKSVACLEAAISVPDPVSLGVLSPLRLFVRVGLFLAVLDSAQLRLLLSSRGFTRVKSALSVSDSVQLESSLLAQSSICSRPLLAVLDLVRLGFLPSIHLLAQLEIFSAVPDLLHPELFLALKSFT